MGSTVEIRQGADVIGSKLRTGRPDELQSSPIWPDRIALSRACEYPVHDQEHARPREHMGRSKIRIRSLSRLDIVAISRIHADACQIAYRFMGWNYTLDDVQSWYASKFPEWDWGRVAVKDGISVGFIAMTSGLIDQLFVHPDAQQQGVGSALLSLALSRDIRPITLHVFEKNTPARRFYERSGFKEADRWFNEQDKAQELLYELT